MERGGSGYSGAVRERACLLAPREHFAGRIAPSAPLCRAGPRKELGLESLDGEVSARKQVSEDKTVPFDCRSFHDRDRVREHRAGRRIGMKLAVLATRVDRGGQVAE